MSEGTISDMQEVIDALLDCEKEGLNCKDCEHKDENCLIFIRNSIAVALQFILRNIVESKLGDEANEIYS